MPAPYRDHVNAHGFGVQFIDELRVRKGPGFARSIKEPLNKAKYMQAQINEMCITLKRNQSLIGEVSTDTKSVLNRMEETIDATQKTMSEINEFRKVTAHTEKLM